MWDSANGSKYSLAHPQLYPETAVLDPALTVGAPRGLTLATGLDALSHALESIWNVNGNPVSANFAVEAAREIIDTLPRLLDRLGDVELRARQARASLLAGLAFSQHQDGARPQHLLRHHAEDRHDPRHRLLVLAADRDGLGDGRQIRTATRRCAGFSDRTSKRGVQQA